MQVVEKTVDSHSFTFSYIPESKGYGVGRRTLKFFWGYEFSWYTPPISQWDGDVAEFGATNIIQHPDHFDNQAVDYPINKLSLHKEEIDFCIHDELYGQVQFALKFPADADQALQNLLTSLLKKSRKISTQKETGKDYLVISFDENGSLHYLEFSINGSVNEGFILTRKDEGLELNDLSVKSQDRKLIESVMIEGSQFTLRGDNGVAQFPFNFGPDIDKLVHRVFGIQQF